MAKWNDELVREWVEQCITDGEPKSPEGFKEDDLLNRTTVKQLARVMENMELDGTLEQLPDGSYRATLTYLQEVDANEKAMVAQLRARAGQ